MNPMTSHDETSDFEAAIAGDPVLADLIAELADQFAAGLEVNLQEVAARYPERAEQLRLIWPTVKMIAALGESSAEGSVRVTRRNDAGEIRPEILGDFRIIREVGRGGMGIVYEAEQISLRRQVALKILPSAAALDSRQLQRFQLEAHAAACLHHTNIVPIHAVGSERGVPFYAMQFIEGQSLADLIKDLRRIDGVEPVDGPASAFLGMKPTPALRLTSGDLGVEPMDRGIERVPPDDHSVSTSTEPVPPIETGTHGSASSTTRGRGYFRNVARLGQQVAEALDHAHTRGILHRDIKPGNLILDGQSNVWVTDFGLAQVQGVHHLTMTGDVLGTLRYMSPEQALARPVVIDGRTDVYSLGVTLYELLCLRHAFEGTDRARILRKIADQEPPRIRANNPAVPRDLETIVHKAMAKSLTERYATARDLADDLQRFLIDRPIRAKPPSFSDRLAKWTRRHWGMVALTVGSLILAVIGLSTATFLIARERADALRQRNDAQGQRLRADERFRLAFQAVEQLNMLIGNDAFRSVGGLERTRNMQRAYRQQMLTFYRDLVEGSEADSRVSPELGISCYRLYGLFRDIDHDRDRAEASLFRSLKIWEQLAKSSPNDPTTIGTVAFLYLKVGDLHLSKGNRRLAEEFYQRSLVSYERVAKDFPNRVDHWTEIANLAQSYQAFLRSDGHRHHEAEILDQRVLAWFNRLDLPGAWLGQATEKIRILTLWSHLAVRAGEPRKAVPLLSLARAFLVTDLEYQHYARAVAYVSETLVSSSNTNLTDANLAIKILKDALEVMPDEVELLCTLSIAYMNTRNGSELRRSLAKVKELAAGNPRLVTLLARRLANHPDPLLRNAAAALELARLAVELMPQEGMAWTVLGMAHYRSGQWKVAKDVLTRSTEQHRGGSGFDWFTLAMAYKQLGVDDQARYWFDRARNWMNRHTPADAELIRLDAEAQTLLGLEPQVNTDLPITPSVRSSP